MPLTLKYIICAQYPALFLLAVFFLVNYLLTRRQSAMKSVLWVLLFGFSLAFALVFLILGMQEGYWSLRTLFPLSGWSWAGIIAALAAALTHGIHRAEKRHSKRVLEKELQKAEQRKEDAVAAAREEGREAARLEAEQRAAVLPPPEAPDAAPPSAPMDAPEAPDGAPPDFAAFPEFSGKEETL